MPTPVRVLILEDRASDAELMVHELAQAGFEPNWQRVETETDYIAQLQAVPDVILADHNLPGFGAPQALELLKEHGLDIPFIVVTGSINEEVAVERIKQGAADYILKDRMARLGAAVKHALQEKKLREGKRKADEEIKRNLERIRALHEINLAITSTLNLRSVLDFLVERLDSLFPFPVATTVRLFNKESGLLEPVACRNLNELVWKAEEGKTSRGPANLVLKTKAPVTIRNVQTDPRVLNPEFFRRYGLISYMGVPLIAKREPLGVLGLYTREEREFTKEEIEFVKALAAQAAIAIYNAQLHEELIKATKVKDEFLSAMSHELRTPLTVVTGYVGMLEDGFLGKMNLDQVKACSKIMRRTEDLISMVNTILFTTSLETKTISVEKHPVNLIGLLSELRSAYEASSEKELALVWDYPAELAPLSTDGAKLKQILQNLIDNAIKFTEKGGVTITARVMEGERQQASGIKKKAPGEREKKHTVHESLPLASRLTPERSVEFEVADTGIGIPKEMLSAIFEKFKQVDSSDTRTYGGVGLGLYIVKRFTEMLGGTVKVESDLGNGSTFTVILPDGR
jgi:signal transduction histidine kinase/CheY-like chemotaxis protein